MNVKVYKSVHDITETEWTGLRMEIADGFSAEWIAEHVDDRTVDAFWQAACEDGLELAQTDADEVFGDHSVRCELDGRSGGWLIVRGLPDVETWDAVMVAKWSRYAKYVAAIVDDIPRACAWLIGANVYEAELTDMERAESTRDDINADALASLKVG